MQVDSAGASLLPTLFWTRNLTVSSQGDVSELTEEIFGVGHYPRTHVKNLGLTVEVDGVELVIAQSSYERLTGKVLDFKNGKFVLDDDLADEVQGPS